MVTKHVVVHGRVQGVYYRAAAEQRARALGVAGWAANRDDGTVEMLLEGDDDAVEGMLRWAREGSEQASVSGIDVDDAEPAGSTGFTTG